MRGFVAVMVAAMGASWLVGCGPACQETCFRVYDESQCGRQASGGVTAKQLIDTCASECESALRNTGGMAGYDPRQRQPGVFVLQNERQAAAWMDCIDASTCEELNPALIDPDDNSSSSCHPL